MPPHCDSIDGPVVKAAKRALDEKNVDLVLPYVYKGAEEEVKRTFDKVITVRSKDGPLSEELIDRYFYETVVRLHREGEGAPYTGLKPAGLDVGPVIPVAEKAIETGSPDELLDLMTHLLRTEINERFDHMMHLKEAAGQSVDHAREYVESMLGLQVYCHKLHECMQAEAHEGEHAPPQGGHQHAAAHR